MLNQPREPQPYEDCQAKSIQEFGWTSQGMDWGWGQGLFNAAFDFLIIQFYLSYLIFFCLYF